MAALAEATQNLVEQAKQRPELRGVYTTLNPTCRSAISRSTGSRP